MCHINHVVPPMYTSTDNSRYYPNSSLSTCLSLIRFPRTHFCPIPAIYTCSYPPCVLLLKSFPSPIVPASYSTSFHPMSVQQSFELITEIYSSFNDEDFYVLILPNAVINMSEFSVVMGDQKFGDPDLPQINLPYATNVQHYKSEMNSNSKLVGKSLLPPELYDPLPGEVKESFLKLYSHLSANLRGKLHERWSKFCSSLPNIWTATADSQFEWVDAILQERVSKRVTDTSQIPRCLEFLLLYLGITTCERCKFVHHG